LKRQSVYFETVRNLLQLVNCRLKNGSKESLAAVHECTVIISRHCQ